MSKSLRELLDDYNLLTEVIEIMEQSLEFYGPDADKARAEVEGMTNARYRIGAELVQRAGETYLGDPSPSPHGTTSAREGGL